MSPTPFRGIGPASLKTALVVDADPQVESVLGAALDPRRWMIQHASDNAQATELPNIEKEEVATAFREMVLNAIEHGGRFDGNQHVEIAYFRTRHVVICRVKDSSPGFSQKAVLQILMADLPMILFPTTPIVRRKYYAEAAL
jgi:hypothetical protein